LGLVRKYVKMDGDIVLAVIAGRGKDLFSKHGVNMFGRIKFDERSNTPIQPS
jgi:hypothetical protein